MFMQTHLGTQTHACIPEHLAYLLCFDPWKDHFREAAEYSHTSSSLLLRVKYAHRAFAVTCVPLVYKENVDFEDRESWLGKKSKVKFYFLV